MMSLDKMVSIVVCLSAIACSLIFAAIAGAQDPFDKAIYAAISKVKPALVQIRVVNLLYEEGREKKSEAYGSGVIIDENGHVLTNHHVAGHAARLFCVLSSKEEFEAELIGTDALSDIAVIRIKKENQPALPFAVLGDSSKVRVGDFVLAMGSPLSIAQSVTLGIVSNTEMVVPRMFERYGIRLQMDGEDVGSMVRWIAHDAPIYGGNSGGPLVNMQGEVVGINEINIGLGGAIPSDLVKKVARQIIEKGRVTRAWLGLEVQPQLKHSPMREGVLVSGVINGSPADKAGFQSGDILVSLNGNAVEVRFRDQLPIFHQMTAELPISQENKAVVIRKGAKKVLKLTPIERQPIELKESELPQWGMTARDLSLMAAKEMSRDTLEGVQATSIRTGGPCGEAKPQILPKDIIVEIDGVPIKNIKDLVAITRKITESKNRPLPVLVAFERNAEKYLTVVNLGISEMEGTGLEAQKAWLDISTQVITRELAEKMGVPEYTGVRIVSIHKGGSAEKAGLRVGDLIVGIDGEKIAASTPHDADVFPALLRQYRIGESVDLSIIRDGKPSVVKADLLRAPLLARELNKYRSGFFDFTVRDLALHDRTGNAWDNTRQGVYVESVDPGGWAAIGNLNSGDLILEVDGEKIIDVLSFQKVMKRIKDKRSKTVVLHVLRGIHHVYIELEPNWDASK